MTFVPQNRANLVAAAEAAAATRRAARRRRRFPRLSLGRFTRRTFVLALIGTALPAGVGAAVVALVHDPGPRGPQTVTTPQGVTPEGRVIDRTPLARLPQSLLAGYGRLGDPPSAQERADTRVRGWARGNSRRFGLDPDAARILAHVDGLRLWIVPGNGYVCLALQEAGAQGAVTGSCNTKAVALREGVQVAVGRSGVGGGVWIYGILPDGIDKIEVTDDDGFRHVEPVSHNAYLLRDTGATVRYPVGNRMEMFRVIGSTG
jgi:hypothetical protein